MASGAMQLPTAIGGSGKEKNDVEADGDMDDGCLLAGLPFSPTPSSIHQAQARSSRGIA